MSRPPLPSPPGSGHDQPHRTFDQLKLLAFDNSPPDKYSPKQWFDTALRQAEHARQAERRGSKPDQFVAYTRLVTAYNNALHHSRIREAKAADPAWATRLTDFKQVRQRSTRATLRARNCTDRRLGSRHSTRQRRSRRSSAGPTQRSCRPRRRRDRSPRSRGELLKSGLN